MARPTAVRSIVTGAAALLALLSLPAEAQWKWRDGAGHVQYSDLPPPASTPDKDILARPAQRKAAQTNAFPASAASGAAVAASGALVARTTDPELEAKRKKADDDKLAKQKVEEDKVAAAKADNCSRARSQVKTLESGVRIARTNEKGEREFLDDSARDAEMKRSRDIVAADCK